jgi:hypothetical protein
MPSVVGGSGVSGCALLAMALSDVANQILLLNIGRIFN